MYIPEEFKLRMKQMLGENYIEFERVMENEPPECGMRINTLKKGAVDAVTQVTGEMDRVPWCSNGYYCNKEAVSGKHPYHVGGLIYFQEPSAMATVEALGIEKGDYVLDLCAAPGGKSTHAAEKLDSSGLLVANEIIPKRAKILAENIGRMGIANAIVTNETPERLASKYPEYFDKIIVDAPCSGEGMFKKEPKAAVEWSEEHSNSCAVRQIEILRTAFKMLKKGGKLIYSTCTFAPCENEGVTERVLNEIPGAELLNICIDGVGRANGQWAGCCRSLSEAIRIFPHEARGEGHYAALFRKNGGGVQTCEKKYACLKEKIYRKFEKENLKCRLDGNIIDFGEKLYLLPNDIDTDGIKILMPGLFLGTCKKNRFEPSHELCLALDKSCFIRYIQTDEPERYFRGETLQCAENGWTAVLYNGYPVGWGKASCGVLKNHFPKYLRF